jgi:bacterioferritin
MQGSPAVIEMLNEILTAELTAINQYFIGAKICDNWGYDRLAEKLHEESIDEMKDADAVMERILFLDGMPNMQRLGSVGIGETVKEQFELDLALERGAIERYNRAVEVCVAESDNGTRALMEKQLRGEEDHADWIESQLELIEQVGLQNYLAEQMKD